MSYIEKKAKIIFLWPAIQDLNEIWPVSKKVWPCHPCNVTTKLKKFFSLWKRFRTGADGLQTISRSVSCHAPVASALPTTHTTNLHHDEGAQVSISPTFYVLRATFSCESASRSFFLLTCNQRKVVKKDFRTKNLCVKS